MKFVRSRIDSSLWKRPRVNCYKNVGQTSLDLNLICHNHINMPEFESVSLKLTKRVLVMNK